MSTLIIAEAGVNHNGCLELARGLVDAAADAGADIIKFQTFSAQSLVTASAVKAEYQRQRTCTSETQHDMLRALELTRDAHHDLIAHCRQRGMRFLSTAFDSQSLEFLHALKLGLYKIPSGEITNLPYLRDIGRQASAVLLSTGMCSLADVDAALTELIRAGTRREQVTVLHCNTEYPTPMTDVNLLAMVSMRAAFGTAVGYSDHTSGIEIPIAAVALGATVIEKHLTLDRNLPGPDHAASLEPAEFKAMVSGIRNVERALGNGIKQPSPSERKNITAARRSIVAARTIRKDELFTAAALTTKRPGTGISPMMWDQVIGRAAVRDFDADEIIEI